MIEHASLSELARYHINDILPHAIATLGLAMAFSKDIRKEVKRRQRGRCDCCGEHAPLQTHHRIPESLGGPNAIENAVGVCQECHRDLDREAFSGMIYPQVHTPARYIPQGNQLTTRR